MSAQDLINWGELSRLLTGSRMNIRKNRIPKKYEEDINNLLSITGKWKSEMVEKEKNIVEIDNVNQEN